MAHFQDIIELRRQRANIKEQMQDLLDRAKNEKRDLGQDEEVQFDKMLSDESELRTKIERLEKFEDVQKSLEGHENRFKADLKDTQQKTEYRDVFKKWLVAGSERLTGEERSILYKNGMDEEARALSATTGAAGGYTVPQGFYNSIVEAMKFYGGMRNVAYVFGTDSGNTLPIPTSNDTGNIGELVAENAQVGTQDIAFSQASLGAYKFSSKLVLVPIELLQDSAFDIEAFIAKKLGERIGRANNQYFTTGTGTAQPQGIVNGAVSGKVGANGQTTSVTVDDLFDLEHSVDKAYRDNAKYMFHDQTLKALKKLKDSQGRLLWLPGLAVKEPDTINNYSYEINNDMAQMGTSAKSILFGDLSNYWIRDVKAIQVVRFNEKYMDYGQVGFLAFSRADGKLVNAGGNPVAYYQNSAT
jgi:HK97 family phage major capsid protein